MIKNIKISIVDDKKSRINSLEKLLDKTIQSNTNFIHVESDIAKAQQNIENDKINIFFIHIDEWKSR